MVYRGVYILFAFQETRQLATELPQCTALCVGMKKLQKLNEFKKFAILKKGIGIESQTI